MNSKSRYAPRRRCADRQSVPERLVNHILERPATVSSGLLKLLREIVIEREGRSHPHIMMRHHISVKMLNKRLTLHYEDVEFTDYH